MLSRMVGRVGHYIVCKSGFSVNGFYSYIVFSFVYANI
jgi:hypothetical protein